MDFNSCYNNIKKCSKSSLSSVKLCLDIQILTNFTLYLATYAKCDFVRQSVLSFVRMLVPRLCDEQGAGTGKEKDKF